MEVIKGSYLDDARSIMAKYPNVRSAVIPLLFLVQAVEGWVTEAGMRDVARLVGITPAQVLATASFYTMLKKRPQGEYLVSICRNITCTHMGARRVIAALEERLGIRAGETTQDGKFTLETAECLATCDGGPSGQINYEDVYNLTPESTIEMVDELAAGGTLTTFRGAEIKSAQAIAYETAMTGAGLDALGRDEARTVSGEVPAADMAPGFRPKVEGSPGGSDHAEGTERVATSQGTPGSGGEGELPTDATGGSESGSPGDRPGHPGSAEEEPAGDHEEGSA
jgi:NADH-quinone oxidoreductase subunit E